MKVKLKLLSYVQLFATPWTVAHQAPSSMGFSRQEYWSGLPFPSPGDLSNPGIKPRSPTLQTDILTSEPPGKPRRRKVKSKGGKERYKHLNAEFQRIARRDKKAFLSDQCKEIEEKMTNLDSILKSRDITLPTKVRLVKAMVFPVVMYGWESWPIKKAECQRIGAFELWCWRRLLRVPDCKEIQPVYPKGNQS